MSCQASHLGAPLSDGQALKQAMQGSFDAVEKPSKADLRGRKTRFSGDEVSIDEEARSFN